MTATIHHHDLGLTWVVDEPTARGSHALVAPDGGVWLVDPTRDDEALAAVAQLGAPAGVLQLLDRHNRDCADLASALGVRHWTVGEVLQGGGELPFEPRRVVWNRFWKEVALWWPQRRGLVVSESLGTVDAFAVGREAVGVHPMRRLSPPHMLKALNPDHLLVGHGPPIHGHDVHSDMLQAIDHAWRDVPKLVAKLPGIVAGMRRR
jgi:hypothetical protein